MFERLWVPISESANGSFDSFIFCKSVKSVLLFANTKNNRKRGQGLAILKNIDAFLQINARTSLK